MRWLKGLAAEYGRQQPGGRFEWLKEPYAGRHDASPITPLAILPGVSLFCAGAGGGVVSGVGVVVSADPPVEPLSPEPVPSEAAGGAVEAGGVVPVGAVFEGVVPVAAVSGGVVPVGGVLEGASPESG
jgi:hypothetical protein